jgi:hypothetical protein
MFDKTLQGIKFLSTGFDQIFDILIFHGFAVFYSVPPLEVEV